MRNIYFIVIVYLTLCALNFGQQVKFNIVNNIGNKALLFSLAGEKSSFVDSLSISGDGQFSYDGENLSTGFYQFRVDSQSPITFIYDGKDVELKADVGNISETLEVVESESNKTYYDFVEINKSYKEKTELLQIILARYPKADDYYRITDNKVSQLQDKYSGFIDSVVSLNPSSFISRYVQSSQLAIVDYTLPVEEQLTYLKSHALDYVDFDDAELINSDCFTNKSIEYLTYYRNPQFPKQLLEQEFQKAVDTLLTKASINILVYQHIADYLIDGFKQFGFDNIVDYIIENYVVKDDLCLDEQTEISIENRINQSKLLKIGSKAPNIALPDTSGKIVELSTFGKEKVLLLFYASWCPHCQDILPDIYRLYKQRIDLEVVAISLDEDREAWIDYIKENDFDWTNLSDLKGWDSEAAQDYYIYATPTMFVLDDNRKILGKPVNISELKSLL